MEKQATAAAPAPQTFEEAVETYIRLEQRGRKANRSWQDTAQRLGLKPDPDDADKFIPTGNGAVAAWVKRPLRSIGESDVQDRIDAKVGAGQLAAANSELRYLRTFFRWCVKKKKIKTNPAMPLTNQPRWLPASASSPTPS